MILTIEGNRAMIMDIMLNGITVQNNFVSLRPFDTWYLSSVLTQRRYDTHAFFALSKDRPYMEYRIEEYACFAKVKHIEPGMHIPGEAFWRIA